MNMESDTLMEISKDTFKKAWVLGMQQALLTIQGQCTDYGCDVCTDYEKAIKDQINRVYPGAI